MKQFNLVTQDWEEAEEKRPSALELLQAIYLDEGQPLSVRMRAASQALPYESPKLAVTALLRDESSFAAALDRAIQRSNAGKVTLELSANSEPEGVAEDNDGTNQ